MGDKERSLFYYSRRKKTRQEARADSAIIAKGVLLNELDTAKTSVVLPPKGTKMNFPAS